MNPWRKKNLRCYLQATYDKMPNQSVKYGKIVLLALQRLWAKDLQMHKTTQPIFLLQYPEYIAGVISIEITLTESI